MEWTIDLHILLYHHLYRRRDHRSARPIRSGGNSKRLVVRRWNHRRVHARYMGEKDELPHWDGSGLSHACDPRRVVLTHTHCHPKAIRKGVWLTSQEHSLSASSTKAKRISLRVLALSRCISYSGSSGSRFTRQVRCLVLHPTAVPFAAVPLLPRSTHIR